MNTVERAILEKFKTLLSSRLKGYKLILFGSRARGDADPASDMDVVVILENTVNDEDREFVSDCAWEAGFQHGIVLVPVVFTRREWEVGPERYSLLAQAVKSEGVPL